MKNVITVTGNHLKSAAVLGLFAFLAACASGKSDKRVDTVIGAPSETPAANPHYKVGNPYKVAGIWYYPKKEDTYERSGVASWYGPKFHGKKTANGEIFDMNRLTAAHPTLPLPSIVQVTNVKNGRTINVRLNDRGPFAHGRIIDMSREAAIRLGFKDDGLAEVKVKYVGPASLKTAITELGQPESYADGTYAMPREEAVLIAANDLDTVHTRIVSGPEIKLTEPATSAEALNRRTLDAARASVRETESNVREEIVTGTSPLDNDAAALPDFNEVMEVMGASPEDDVWMVQIGAFSSDINAEKAASRFGRTIPVHRESIVNSSGSGLTLIRLGPYRSQGEAKEALRLAQHSGFNDAHIVGP